MLKNSLKTPASEKNCFFLRWTGLLFFVLLQLFYCIRDEGGREVFFCKIIWL